ncbi:Methionine import system permease protein MetP [Serratia quinivorans]|uniref:Methionine import system permease protein MetP n=1 Tax=Serratia quinivorans TaxID=137545 RepID=A0A379YNK8_9GAMM|nr:Methionine import system permease protein MetP [Serratia quinivorans]
MIESWFPHLRIDQLLNATWETLYMTGIAGLATLVLGIVLGVLLFLTSRGQLLQNRAVYSLISVLVNVFRSIPLHYSDRAADPVHQDADRHHFGGRCRAAGADCRRRALLRPAG